MKKYILMAFVIFSFLLSHLCYAQEEMAPEVAKDSTKTDTTLIKAKIYIPSHFHGANSIAIEPYQSISKRDILYQNYTDFSDILYDNTSAYPLSLGSFGQNNSASFFGANHSAVSYGYNGRSINEPDYGGFNVSQFPAEFFEKAEIFTGSDAVILSDNANGAYINFQEIYYNTAKPYTRLWYSQAGFDFLSADGIYSQNIAPNLNVTGGFRSMTTLGEYDNEKLRSWNGRLRLRYALDSLRTVSLTENYSNLKSGLNGGINPDKSNDYYNSYYAQPHYSSLYENTFRHDITLAYSSVAHDSSSFLRASAFFTNINRQLYNGDFYFIPENSTKRLDYSNNYFGANTQYDKNLGKAELSIGGDFAYYILEQTPYVNEDDFINAAIFTRGEYGFSDILKFSIGGRLSQINNQTAYNAGGKIISKIGANSKLMLDASYSEKTPTPTEKFAGDNLMNEKHLLALLRFDSKIKAVNYSIEAFYRNIDNAITGTPLYNEDGDLYFVTTHNQTEARKIIGVSINTGFNITKKIHADWKTSFYYSTTADTADYIYPLVTSKIKMYYLIEKVRSDMRIGLACEFLSPFTGTGYSPLQRLNYNVERKNDQVGVSLDAFVAARFSSVHVRIDYKNILGYGYYYMPYYPQMGRNLRFSLSFPFLPHKK